MAKTHICVNQIALSNPTKLVCAILRLLIKCRTISFAVKYLTIKHTHTSLLKKSFFQSSKLYQQEVPTLHISYLCLWNAYLLFSLAAWQPLRLLVCLKVLRIQKQIKHATRKYLRANTIYAPVKKKLCPSSPIPIRILFMRSMPIYKAAHTKATCLNLILSICSYK